jgi:alpha/beta hydrolase family protein
LSDGYRRDHPYKTRIVVRRPADAKRFNGTVLVEWDNVTNGFDAEKVWFFSWEQMVRAGYAWVGVSAQQFGVNALKTFSTARYATTKPAGAGKVVNGERRMQREILQKSIAWRNALPVTVTIRTLLLSTIFTKLYRHHERCSRTGP